MRQPLYAGDFINACAYIRDELPYALTSGGEIGRAHV